MRLPDALARVLAHVEPEFGAIRDGLERASGDPRDPATFAGLPETRRLLESVQPAAASHAGPTTGGEYLSFLYALFAFWNSGGKAISASRDALAAVMADDSSRATSEVPNGACYVQLPSHWFWGQVSDDAPHEPLDGCFVVTGPRDRTVTVVALLGLHPGRAGFSQITVSVSAAEAESAFGSVRPDRFAPTMEGGDRMGLHAVTSPAELLVLVQLALAAAAG